MSEFRRRLLTADKDPDFISSLIVWYSPKKQGATNDSLLASPILKDLSGNGKDLSLENLDFSQNHIDSNYGLIIDRTVSISLNVALADFTVFFNRTCSKFPTIQGTWASYCEKGSAFMMDNVGGARISSYPVFEYSGQYNRVASAFANVRGVFIRTPQALYRKVSSFEKAIFEKPHTGTGKDTPDSLLAFGRFARMNLYDFLLFDKTLSEEEIKWVINNLID